MTFLQSFIFQVLSLTESLVLVFRLGFPSFKGVHAF